MIALLAYFMHQASVANLPGNSTVLRELNLTSLNQTSTEVAAEIVEMFYQKPVPEWADVMDTAAFPHDYYTTFSAFVTTILGIALPWSLVEVIIPFLVNKIVPGAPADFIINHYMPEYHTAISGLSFTFEQKLTLLTTMAGVVMKILYAFLF